MTGEYIVSDRYLKKSKMSVFWQLEISDSLSYDCNCHETDRLVVIALEQLGHLNEEQDEKSKRKKKGRKAEIE